MTIPRAKSGNKSSGVLRNIIRTRNTPRATTKPQAPPSTTGLGRNQNVLRDVAKPRKPSSATGSGSLKKGPCFALMNAQPVPRESKNFFIFGSNKSSSLPIHGPPYLPPLFRQYIDSLGGQEVKLVMQKVLTRSDLHPDSGRLTLPENQFVSNVNLLRKQESTIMMITKEISVGVISSKLEEKAFKLKVWMTFKGARIAGQPEPLVTRVYTLQGGWLDFARENHLKENDRVQVSSFRVIDEVLHESLKLLIVKLNGED
ncbi:hypothetical protein MLD38_010784 [Melastoma candidum]|uniref:Uncharacterized protein n=1 Tax=Melastoma candidum TaxID=119954 RepID=A0ACB9R0G0_9MYRT|nr:hypothetical protein MLD38_010784 [Melastoma candidum]